MARPNEGVRNAGEGARLVGVLNCRDGVVKDPLNDGIGGSINVEVLRTGNEAGDSIYKLKRKIPFATVFALKPASFSMGRKFID
jgi:hypothetical protein